MRSLPISTLQMPDSERSLQSNRRNRKPRGCGQSLVDRSYRTLTGWAVYCAVSRHEMPGNLHSVPAGRRVRILMLTQVGGCQAANA
jgi:hypothetical protein